jgi:uncharacterized protein YceH (UPF0502 family)
VDEQANLRLYTLAGEPLHTYEEEQQARRAAEERWEQEARERAAAEERAGEERARREALEREVAELRARLAREGS